MTFEIAALSPGQENFDDSSEAFMVDGFLPGVGMELHSNSGTPSYVNVRGLGWYSNDNTLGPDAASNCHVFIDRFTEGGFTGRIRCAGMRDDSTPPQQRLVRAAVGSAMPDFGEFAFTNCSTTPPS